MLSSMRLGQAPARWVLSGLWTAVGKAGSGWSLLVTVLWLVAQSWLRHKLPCPVPLYCLQVRRYLIGRDLLKQYNEGRLDW